MMRTRRIVTGHNKDGRSMVKWDSELESKPGRDRFEKVELWATATLPARLTEDEPTQWNLGTSLANGSVFRLGRPATKGKGPGDIIRIGEPVNEEGCL